MKAITKAYVHISTVTRELFIHELLTLRCAQVKV